MSDAGVQYCDFLANVDLKLREPTAATRISHDFAASHILNTTTPLQSPNANTGRPLVEHATAIVGDLHAVGNSHCIVIFQMFQCSIK